MGGNNSEADREGSERTVVDDEVAPPIVVENTISNTLPELFQPDVDGHFYFPAGWTGSLSHSCVYELQWRA